MTDWTSFVLLGAAVTVCSFPLLVLFFARLTTRSEPCPWCQSGWSTRMTYDYDDGQELWHCGGCGVSFDVWRDRPEGET